MKMSMSITVNEQRFYLRRLHSKLGECITWEVLSDDKIRRYGVIARLNSQWMTKRFGWREIPITYWLFHYVYPIKVISGMSMREALSKAQE